MPAVLDTSVLVRYVTFDPPTQGEVAAALIDSEADLLVTSVGLAETAFVLTRNYGLPRSTVVDTLTDLLARENVDMVDLPKALAVDALNLCRPSGRVSYADALEWAVARHNGVPTVYTFDQAFPSQEIDRRVLPRRVEGGKS
jgi:predicted nucleic acid-binding protein